MLTENKYEKSYKLKVSGDRSGGSKFSLKTTYFYTMPYTRINVQAKVNKTGVTRTLTIESPDDKFRVFVIYVWGLNTNTNFMRLSGVELTLNREYEWIRNISPTEYNLKIQDLIDQGYICVNSIHTQITDPFFSNKANHNQNDRIACTIKRRRDALAITQIRLSEDAKLWPSTVSRFERGYQSIRIDGLFRMLDPLRLNIYAVDKKTCAVISLPDQDAAQYIIKQRRSMEGISLDALAMMSKIHASTISNIERCMRGTNLDILTTIYDALNLSIIMTPYNK